MKPILPLFIMVDACGWEIVRNDPFPGACAPYRRRLRSVFGYSSACVPSIVSGRWPAEHRNWCYFVYDPARSPFRALRSLRWLPKAVTSRRIARRWLTQMARNRLGFSGYFDLYNIPFRHIGLYDFTEKKSPLRPKGMNRGQNIFDLLEERHVPYFVSDPEVTEKMNLSALMNQITGERIDFAFMYWPGLDGLLHRVGNDSMAIHARLRVYEGWIAELLAATRSHYAETRLYVFSDHGMANCDEQLDLMSIMDTLKARMGSDYVAVYDSTMARFWFHNEAARSEITGRLRSIEKGRILEDEELARLGVLFEDRYFGELIFLVREGVLICPSHMGERPIRAMHGYHPDDLHSHAAVFSSNPISPGITDIPHLFDLMVGEMEAVLCENRRRSAQGSRVLAAESAPGTKEAA